eukprot:1617919-Ditylum_brightwellii.AAC.1
MKKQLCIMFPHNVFSPCDLGEEEAYYENMTYIPNLEKTGYVNHVICITMEFYGVVKMRSTHSG